MSIEDPYLSLAPFYERPRMDWFGEAMIDRLLDLLRDLLRERGVDLSPGLLGIVRGIAPRHAVEFFHGDIAALDRGRRFVVVVSAGGVFDYLPSIDVWS